MASSKRKTRSTKSLAGLQSNMKSGATRRRGRYAGKLQTTGRRSGYELKVTQNLEARGIPYKYEPDCLVYDLPVKGATCKKCGAPGVTRAAHYTPDLKFDNGTYVELKGRFTSANRTRLLAFRSTRPSVVLRVLFQRDNYLTKRNAKTYTEWATANGFECAVGEKIPEEWTK